MYSSIINITHKYHNMSLLTLAVNLAITAGQNTPQVLAQCRHTGLGQDLAASLHEKCLALSP